MSLQAINLWNFERYIIYKKKNLSRSTTLVEVEKQSQTTFSRFSINFELFGTMFVVFDERLSNSKNTKINFPSKLEEYIALQRRSFFCPNEADIKQISPNEIAGRRIKCIFYSICPLTTTIEKLISWMNFSKPKEKYC